MKLLWIPVVGQPVTIFLYFSTATFPDLLIGNGWAAAGMLRVLATITASPFQNSLSEQTKNLTLWTFEILNSTFSIYYPQSSNSSLLPNYMDDPTSFVEASGFSILTYALFRLASLNITTIPSQLLSTIEQIYQNIGNNDILETGTLNPVVNPYSILQNFGSSISPEGQAFLLLLSSARRDYLALLAQASSKGINDQGQANLTTLASSPSMIPGINLNLPAL